MPAIKNFSSKFTLFACSVDTELGPLSIFLLPFGTVLGSVGRRHWRDPEGGEDFSSWIWRAAQQGLSCSCSVDISRVAGSCTV